MRYLTIIFLLIGLNSQAQIIRAQPFYVPQASAGLLLDTYTAFGGYSLRKLRTAYSGNCIQVRRKSDNTLQNIGFVNNYLDTVSLKTFVGTSATDTGFIRTWYDQAGTVDFTQTTNANQPLIMASGKMIYQGSKCTVLPDGNKQAFMTSSNAFGFLNNGTKSAVFTVYSNNTNNTFYLLGNGRVGNTAVFAIGQTSANNLLARVDSSVGNTVALTTKSYTNNVTNLASVILDLTNSTLSEKIKLYINNVIGSNNTATRGPGSAGQNMALFRDGTNARNFYGNMSEIIFFNTDQSANRTAIQNNINSFYSIY